MLGEYSLSISLILSFANLCMVTPKTLNYRIYFSSNCGSPDGVEVCHIITANKRFPGPTIRGYVGDTLSVVVENRIVEFDGAEEGTSIHWHGLFFNNGLGIYDGPPCVTQCLIAPNCSMDYRFPLVQSGTFWWHAHGGYQYTEGLLGALIIKDYEDPYLPFYDYDNLVFTLGDWYHTPSKILLAALERPGGRFPTPDSILINGHGSFNCSNTNLKCKPKEPLVYEVYAGKRYRIRIINVSTVYRMTFSIDDHLLTVIEVDGVLTERVDCTSITLSPGQRYSMIVEMNADCDNNRDFLIRSPSPDDVNRVGRYNASAILRYKKSYNYQPYQSYVPYAEDETCETQTELIELDERKLCALNYKNNSGEPFETIFLDVVRMTTPDGVTRFTFNGVPFNQTCPPVLYRMIEGKPIPPEVNPLTLQYQKLYCVQLYNGGQGHHPFHLHGHNFQIMSKGARGSGRAISNYYDDCPVVRDTVDMEGNSTLVFCFVSDNPGAWMFHCHINWHHLEGLAAVFVEAPEETRTNVIFPPFAKKVCEQSGFNLTATASAFMMAN